MKWHFWGTKTHTVSIQLKCNIHWHTKCAELLWGLNIKRLFYNQNYLKYAIYMITKDSCFRAPTIIFNTSQADLLHQWIPKGMGIKMPLETQKPRLCVVNSELGFCWIGVLNSTFTKHRTLMQLQTACFFFFFHS